MRDSQLLTMPRLGQPVYRRFPRGWLESCNLCIPRAGDTRCADCVPHSMASGGNWCTVFRSNLLSVIRNWAPSLNLHREAAILFGNTGAPVPSPFPTTMCWLPCPPPRCPCRKLSRLRANSESARDGRSPSRIQPFPFIADMLYCIQTGSQASGRIWKYLTSTDCYCYVNIDSG